MSRSETAAGRRAERLLRWYPRTWRERYGEEFAELLNADLDETPRSWRRTADVAARGLSARLSLAGLGGSPIGRPQLAVATAGVSVLGFLALATSIWSQFVTVSTLAPPGRRAVVAGVVLSGVMVWLVVLAALSAAPVAVQVIRSIPGRGARSLALPIVMVVAGLGVLIIGGLHFAADWPGVASASPRGLQLLPRGVVAFGWAETMSITTYWAHPATLAALPWAQTAWIAVSPAALITVCAGWLQIARRVTLSTQILTFQARLADAAVVSMLLSFAVGGWWVVSSRSASDSVLRTGTLDLVVVASMAVALLMVRSAASHMGRRVSG